MMRKYTADEVRHAVERLKRTMQSSADRIRYSECHCRKRGLMLSYADEYTKPRGERNETCGFWCATCNWGNGGARPLDPAQDDSENWNDDSERAL